MQTDRRPLAHLVFERRWPNAYAKAKDDAILWTALEYANDMPMDMAIDAALCTYSDKAAWLEKELQRYIDTYGILGGAECRDTTIG